MRLPPPATGVEIYLAAIHDRLGLLLDRLDGGRAQDPSAAEPAAVPPAEHGTSPTRRTRTRTRAGEQR